MDVVFFFKQKTAYEMRISDWSSDVCSSDLLDRGTASRGGARGSCAGAGQGAVRAVHRTARPAPAAWAAHARGDRRADSRGGRVCAGAGGDVVTSSGLRRPVAATATERQVRMLRTAMGPVIAAALEDPEVVEVLLN